MRPAFLDRLSRWPQGKPDGAVTVSILEMVLNEPPTPDVSAAARTLSETRVNRERNRVIDEANAMRARMGMATMIPRRPA